MKTKISLKLSFLRMQESSIFGSSELLYFWIPVPCLKLAGTGFMAMTISLLFPFHAMASDISIHGFLQGNYSYSTTENPDGGDFKWGEERIQLKIDAAKEQFRLFIKADASYDHIDEDSELELRETYIDYTASKWDLRLGRQIITWGLGDLIFINDVFPKDYEAFFSGRPLEYLKKGIDGIKVGVYPEFASFEIIVIPFFESNNYPAPKRFYMFDPMPTVTNREENEPQTAFKNTEFALRAYRDIAGFDASVYFYRGYFRKPYMLPDNLNNTTKITLFYPEVSVYGASLQGRMLDGVLSLEAGHYDSREDRSGTDWTVPNSQTRFLIGYQRQIWEDFTAGLQYYGEYMHDYSDYKENQPAGLPRDKRFYQLATIRLTQFLMHQTLKLSLFSFYSPSDGDYMLNPELKYNFSDNVWAAIGWNIFGGGEEWSQFGQLAQNDNIYLQLRYEF
ncbi:MAG: hypothetical protein HZC45_07880 [Deltaproteobacteria bacterium]|nr:hypothetical protein [Deltaproteobacteria bacterium]